MKLNDIVMASTQDTKIRVVSSICRGVDVTWLDY